MEYDISLLFSPAHHSCAQKVLEIDKKLLDEKLFFGPTESNKPDIINRTIVTNLKINNILNQFKNIKYIDLPYDELLDEVEKTYEKDDFIFIIDNDEKYGRMSEEQIEKFIKIPTSDKCLLLINHIDRKYKNDKYRSIIDYYGYENHFVKYDDILTFKRIMTDKVKSNNLKKAISDRFYFVSNMCYQDYQNDFYSIKKHPFSITSCSLDNFKLLRENFSDIDFYDCKKININETEIIKNKTCRWNDTNKRIGVDSNRTFANLYKIKNSDKRVEILYRHYEDNELNNSKI